MSNIHKENIKILILKQNHSHVIPVQAGPFNCIAVNTDRISARLYLIKESNKFASCHSPYVVLLVESML